MVKLTDKEKEYLRSNKELLQKRTLMDFYNKCNIDVDSKKIEVENIGRFTDYFLQRGIDVFKYLRDYIPKYCFFFTTTKNIVIPNYIKRIKYATFYGGMVEKIYIPESIESISAKAFQNCGDLKEIEIAGNLDPFEVAIDAFRNINDNAHIIVYNEELYEFFTEIKELKKYNWNIELR